MEVAPVDIAQLYGEFHQSLLRYIRSKINSKEDGEDILHNVFVKISEKGDSLSRKDNLKNWLFLITRNAVIDYYRKKSVRKRVNLDETLIDRIAGEEEANVTGGVDQCLAKFIERLPETYKPMLIDSELKGIKQKELADKYHLAYSSLRSRVQRGREKVRQQLIAGCRNKNDHWGNILEATPKNKCAEEMCKKWEG